MGRASRVACCVKARSLGAAWSAFGLKAGALASTRSKQVHGAAWEGLQGRG